MSIKKQIYHGSPVIEGVLMEGPYGKSIASRNEDGDILYKIYDKGFRGEKSGSPFSCPILRGILHFFSTLLQSAGALLWSARQTGETEDEKFSLWSGFWGGVGALIFAVLVFVALPVLAATYAGLFVGPGMQDLIEGLLRAVFFIVYLLGIGRYNDIRRLFAYHGAGHKTINAYEAGETLTPQAVSCYSRLNRRCRGGGILGILLLLMLIFPFLGEMAGWPRFLLKLFLFLLLVGVNGEIYHLLAMKPENPLAKALTVPGLLFQRLVVREPDTGQIQVAIAGLKAVPGFLSGEIQEAGRSLVYQDGDTTMGQTTVLSMPAVAAQSLDGQGMEKTMVFSGKGELEPSALIESQPAVEVEAAAPVPGIETEPNAETIAAAEDSYVHHISSVEKGGPAKKPQPWKEKTLLGVAVVSVAFCTAGRAIAKAAKTLAAGAGALSRRIAVQSGPALKKAARATQKAFHNVASGMTGFAETMAEKWRKKPKP